MKTCPRTLLIVWIAALSLLLGGRMATAAEDRPNFIVFIADDVSWNDYGCYGNPAARTPNIDRLAETGIRFTEAFLTASSCSPSRASIITGRYPHNSGKAAELHLPIASHLPWLPTVLRRGGYYTALAGKNHMSGTRDEPWNVIKGGRVPGNSGGHGHWVEVIKNRPQDKPFFCWFAGIDAHRGWDGDKEWDAQRYGPKHEPQDVIVPPFLSDDPRTRADLASYYNEVTRFDYYVGQVVTTLREEGELENTLIFVLADNGRPFPRAKTRLHDSGMKTALVAHWPAVIERPAVCKSLVSVIDLAPTMIQAAGLDVPATMQGVSMLPLLRDPSASIRDYAFSEHNWHDYEAHGRAVRDGEFLYIRNRRPQRAWQGPADSVRSPSHQRLLALDEAGRLSPAQADVLLAPRPEEELYHTGRDPHQLNNLIDHPSYADAEKRLQKVLTRWEEETADSAPANLSADSFDRRTGDRLKVKDYRGTTPGEDRNAAQVNAPGPR